MARRSGEDFLISIEYSTRIPPTGYYLCGSLFIYSTDLMPLDPAACVADQLPH